jgi:hypothetical protein
LYIYFVVKGTKDLIPILKAKILSSINENKSYMRQARVGIRPTHSLREELHECLADITDTDQTSKNSHQNLNSKLIFAVLL